MYKRAYISELLFLLGGWGCLVLGEGTENGNNTHHNNSNNNSSNNNNNDSRIRITLLIATIITISKRVDLDFQSTRNYGVYPKRKRSESPYLEYFGGRGRLE